MKRSAPLRRANRLFRAHQLARTAAMKAHKPKRERETMGTQARRKFVSRLECAACSRVATEDYPSQNAHVLPKRETGGGMGRKGSCIGIAPLCVRCHDAFDRRRSEFDKQFPFFDPRIAAAFTEAAWQLELQKSGRGDHSVTGDR